MKHRPKPHPHKIYAVWLGLVWAGLYLGILAINSAVDPLWYFHGNLITGKNFGFNEREAKLNQLLRDPGQYDCLIFGSSRATWMPASAFEPLKCFNLSFSSGQPKEFIAFAEYLRERGIRPKYIVVGVDGFIFQTEGRDPLSIPAHVTEKRDPPNIWRTYLSIGSLYMTWRTLTEDVKSPGYYDTQFEKTPRKVVPTFDPLKSLAGEGILRADAEARRKRQYSPYNARLYQELAGVFPGAVTLAYVPPVSAWHIAEMQQYGVLDGYLHALHTTATLLPVFLDFSVPSPITWNTDNTYDGSHYLPGVNRKIANALLARKPIEWGIAPKTLSFEAYRARYQSAWTQFQLKTAVDRTHQRNTSQ